MKRYFFSKIKIDNIDNYFNDLVIKSLNIESPSIGTEVTHNTEITCTFNLLIHYILNSQNENNLFESIVELIKSKIDSIVFKKIY